MSQSLTQFAQEVGRSRDTVTRAIATLGLTVPKPPPGKPTQIPPAVQASLKTHFGAYPQVQPEPQPKPQPQIDPILMAALERIYRTNIQSYKALHTQVSALEVQTGDLKEELAELTHRMDEFRTAFAPHPPIPHPLIQPKRPTAMAPMAIAATLLMAIAVWFFQQSPQPQSDRLNNPARAELYQ